jgi:hypothetical protein
MRETGDYRKDYEVKADILNAIIDDYDFLFAVDDKESNCQMYKNFGIQPLQVWV